jgi:hypothetical protein
MKQVSTTHHLTRRMGVWYYRRRVPNALVPTFGKIIQFSLQTTSLKEAKRLRAVEDLKCATKFEAAEQKIGPPSTGTGTQSAEQPPRPLTESEVIRLVKDYVERSNARAQRRLAADPPTTEQERREMLADAEYGAETIRG